MTAKKKPRKAREWWGILHDEACPIYGNDLGELDGYKTRGGRSTAENYCIGTCKYVRVREVLPPRKRKP